MNEADRTLELSSQELRGLIEAATARILAYIESLPRQPSGDTAGGAALARSLREPLPETGRPAGELLDLLFERVIPKGFNTAGPGYLAYIPGGGLSARGGGRPDRRRDQPLRRRLRRRAGPGADRDERRLLVLRDRGLSRDGAAAS